MTAHTPATESVQTPVCFPAWRALRSRAEAGVPHLRTLLTDPNRHTLSAVAEGTGIRLDYSRQAIDDRVLTQLLALAAQADVEAQRDAMFRGDTINTTEQRAVLHVALRGTPGATGAQAPWGDAIQQQVQTELDRVCAFAAAVRSGQVRGSTGLAFTDVVNIGIGGSDLGPRMATDALAHL
ncbi:MAG: glucose-6-phosphate isomerase, partial [Burkholderiales bacterium]|nr:glucose-6-phosphate isomerase [Burkholderiales bacterium]